GIREIIAGAVSGPLRRIDFAMGADDRGLALNFADLAAKVIDEFRERVELRLAGLAVVEIADEADADGDVVQVVAVDMAALNLPVPSVADFDGAVLRRGAVADDEMIREAV